MDYHQFEVAYGRVMEAAGAGAPAAALAGEVVRLRALADSLPEPTDRRDAAALVDSLEDVLSYDAEPLSPAMTEAVRVLALAGAADGTPSERQARARAGMDEIARISAGADRPEQAAILELNESLALLIDSLESSS